MNCDDAMTNRRNSKSAQSPASKPNTKSTARRSPSSVEASARASKSKSTGEPAKTRAHAAPASRQKVSETAGTKGRRSPSGKPSKATKRSARSDATPASGRQRTSDRPPSLPLYQEPKRGRGRRKASCTACGLCCSYVAIEVDAPATVKEATQLLWYVYHEGVSLYDNDDEWMVQFDTTCIYLQPDYRCGIYETRPHICREFSEQDCEVNTGDDGRTFYNATEYLDHLRTTRPRIYALVMKGYAPPAEPPRARLAPFEHRFQAVVSRRKALGV